jgi:hypothetical protein
MKSAAQPTVAWTPGGTLPWSADELAKMASDEAAAECAQ